jgi:hypothetical protein
MREEIGIEEILTYEETPEDIEESWVDWFSTWRYKKRRK